MLTRPAIRLCSLLLLISLAKAARADSPTIARDPKYPAHWWTPVPTNGAPSWEILPQEAGPAEVILSKRNELGLLSNFAPTVHISWKELRQPRGILADDEISGGHQR